MSETRVAHLALARLLAELCHSYEPDDGPLNPRQVAALRKSAGPFLPTGSLVSRHSLF